MMIAARRPVVGPPTPAARREEQAEIGEEDRGRDEPWREVQLLLQIRREQPVDGVIGDKAAGEPNAGCQGVGENTTFEDGDEGGTNLASLDALAAPVLEPNGRLFDVLADIENGKRWEDTDPQHAAPADVAVEQAIDRAR